MPRRVLSRVFRRLYRQFSVVRAMKAILLLLLAVVGVLGLGDLHAITSAIGNWIRDDLWHLGAVVLGFLLVLFFLSLCDAESDLAKLESVTLHRITVKPEPHESLSFAGKKTIRDILIFRVAVEVRNTGTLPIKVEFSRIELLTRATGWRRWKAVKVKYDKEIQEPTGGVKSLSWRPWEEHDIAPKHKRNISLDCGIRGGDKYRIGQLKVRFTMDVVGQSLLTHEVRVSFPSPQPEAPLNSTAS